MDELSQCLIILKEIAVKGDDKARLLAVENCLAKIIQNGSKTDPGDKPTSPSDQGGAPSKSGASSGDAGASLEGKSKEN